VEHVFLELFLDSSNKGNRVSSDDLEDRFEGRANTSFVLTEQRFLPGRLVSAVANHRIRKPGTAITR
jgi:hypothetical protein